jgi:hypothetical protein
MALDAGLRLGAGDLPEQFTGDATLAAAELLAGVARYSTDDEQRSVALAARCDILRRRHEGGADPEALDAAVAAGEASLSLLPVEDPRHPPFRLLLGQALLARADLPAHAGDLDAAIQHFREGASLMPDRGDGMWHLAHKLLGAALVLWWQRDAVVADLDSLIEALRVAWQSSRDGPDTAVAEPLAGSLLRRAARSGHGTSALADLDEADAIVTVMLTKPDAASAGGRLCLLRAEVSCAPLLPQ